MRVLLALCLLFAAAASADTMSGVVIVVIDGDTVLFKPDHPRADSRAFLKIRLADIDAPEKDQPYGDAASRELAALVLHQRVEVSTVATDTYGRMIARIQISAVPVNAELVRRGLAWSSTRSRNDSGLKHAQREARLAQRGLWQDAEPVPPWVWRQEHSAFAY
ncbi:MAG: thermonuclease family protein [Thiobacillus sp.]